MSTNTIAGRDHESGRVIEIRAEERVVAHVEERSGDTDLFLAPGLVDLQVNGFVGFDVNAPDVTPQTIHDLVYAMLQLGVTCFAPTIITAPEERICAGLQVIAEARRRWSIVADCIPYVHVEGPHISALDGYRGAHPADSVRPPSVAEFRRWQDASGGLVGMVTMSPHFRDSANYIVEVVKSGVHVAIGHTHASSEEIARAVDAGATLSTHLGNGLPSQIARHHNPVWPQLAEDRLTASFIADGHHLPSDMLKVMLRAKSLERTILVSDSVAIAGMPPGFYDTSVGGRVELKPDGRLCIAGSELLAGATASLPECIWQAAQSLDLPMHQVLLLATENPGRFAQHRGRLGVGSRADAVRFRWENGMIIEDVWLGGEKVFTRGEGTGFGRCDRR